jgi:quercetin dioxygenase-like cupin family protein
MRQHVVPTGAGPDYDWANDHVFVKSPQELTDGRTTVVVDILKPGFALPRHHHQVMAEIFYILDGDVTFAFDDETIVATPGTMVTIPAGVRHAVSCVAGGRLITIFSPGGFDQYLAMLAALTPAELADAERMTALNERYDIWPD